MCDALKQEATVKPIAASSEQLPQLQASALAADGTIYALGVLSSAATVLSVKQLLSKLSDMAAGSQSMYLIDDAREGEDELELRNHETIGEVQRYVPEGAAELRFAVMLGLAIDAAEFVRGLVADVGHIATLGDGTIGHEDFQLNFSCGVAFVPAYPELLVTVSINSKEVCVYHRDCQVPLCKIGKGAGRSGKGELEFSDPWGAVVTADSAHVLVVDKGNSRVHKLQLVVEKEEGEGENMYADARLEHASFIGAGCLKAARGIGMRRVGDQETILVAEYTGHRVSEYTMDGTLVRFFGLGSGISGGGSEAFGEAGGESAARRAEESSAHVIDNADGTRSTTVTKADGTKVSTVTSAEGAVIQTHVEHAKGEDGAITTASLRHPCDVCAIPTTDEVAVADYMNHRIAIFEGATG
jgi:hypothetical protein